jgi:hypothetical protein
MDTADKLEKVNEPAGARATRLIAGAIADVFKGAFAWVNISDQIRIEQRVLVLTDKGGGTGLAIDLYDDGPLPKEGEERGRPAADPFYTFHLGEAGPIEVPGRNVCYRISTPKGKPLIIEKCVD